MEPGDDSRIRIGEKVEPWLKQLEHYLAMIELNPERDFKRPRI